MYSCCTSIYSTTAAVKHVRRQDALYFAFDFTAVSLIGSLLTTFWKRSRENVKTLPPVVTRARTRTMNGLNGVVVRRHARRYVSLRYSFVVAPQYYLLPEYEANRSWTCPISCRLVLQFLFYSTLQPALERSHLGQDGLKIENTFSHKPPYCCCLPV